MNVFLILALLLALFVDGYTSSTSPTTVQSVGGMTNCPSTSNVPSTEML